MQRRRRPDLNIKVAAPPKTSNDAAPVPRTPPRRQSNPPSQSQLPLKGVSPSVALSNSTSALKQQRPTAHTAKDVGGAFLEDKTPTTLEDIDMHLHNLNGTGSGSGNGNAHSNGSSNRSSADPSEPLSRRPDPHLRDSHDLSLSPRNITRDSLVTNMLISLDQLSMPQRPTYESLFGAPDALGSRAMSVSRTATTTRPGHEYSYSSDFEGTDDTSRVSSQYSRGRRSNSSSGFQTTLGRINSLRETGQKSQPGTPRHAHSRGGRGSKSSSSNSVDAGYVQVLSNQRWAHGFGGRSSSFDQGHPIPGTGPVVGSVNGQNPWHIDFSNNLFSSKSNTRGGDYDAAPTPTIPGGPRRLNTVPSLPSFPSAPPMTEARNSPGRAPGVAGATTERKRSTRSSRSATVGRATQAKNLNISSRDLPPLPVPAFDVDSAPAPHVGYEKSKVPVHGDGSSPTQQQQGQQLPQQQQKEKIGFFRRVFGGGARKDNNTPSSDAVSSSTHSGADGGSHRGQHTTGMKSQSTPPSRDSQHSPHSTAHSHSHSTLQKKSSSFFRRQKKAAEPPPSPPPLPQSMVLSPPATVPPRINSPKPEWSPAFTRAMAPYLDSRGSSPTKDTTDGPAPAPDVPFDKNPQRVPPKDPEFSRTRPEPLCSTSGNKKAIPHTEPKPKPREDYNKPVQSVQSMASVKTPTRQPPDPPQTHPNLARTGSFLNDSSDTDGESKRPRKPEKQRKKRPETSKLVLPIEGAVLEGGGSVTSKSATSLPSVKIDESEPSPRTVPPSKMESSLSPPSKLIDEPEFVIGEPTDDDRQKAQKIYDGNEDFIQKERAAGWMGEEGPVRQRTLRAYMSLYDFTGRSIVSCVREVCGRLVMKAETQQVDRILAAFAKRWCDCNPSHGYKATDVVHTICYSIMLLNTDLHMADIEQKMTRSQFVKNTVGTIRQALADAAPDAFGRQSILPGKNQQQSLSPDDGRTSLEQERLTNNFRHSFLGGVSAKETDPDDCGPLVNSPFEGTLRAWEAQVETVLKDTYNSIRDERLPLFGADPQQLQLQTQNGLSVMGLLKRSPSVLSKAPSEGHGSTRGRNAESARLPTTLRWTSKSRSRARVPFAPPNGGFSSSRTSFEDGNSTWSPTVSSATRSRYSLGRTQTSMSIESLGSGHPNSNFHQSIGFANALSQAIVREEAMGASLLSLSPTEDLSVKPLLDDESLELAGPPWVKEGRVIHKHHLDGIDKKAKDRNWNEVFAVIQKGTLSLFSFAPNKSLSKKSRGRAGIGSNHNNNKNGGGGAVVVGGGNWQENATNLGTFSLKQTLASGLPPPGYSTTRPHVWVLSLPTGAVHLFQVGTPEISKEFVTTANYWSARLSTHPLVGGISNIEYGWSEAVINNPLVTAIAEATAIRPGSGNVSGHPTGMRRGSLHSRASSFRSASLDFVRTRSGSVQSVGPGPVGMGGGLDGRNHLDGHGGGGSSHSNTSPGMGGSGGGGSGTAKLPGDRIHIAEWRPPAQSLRASALSESDQLSTLITYVSSIEEELRQHNALRSPMLLAFSPRGSNAAKAMANWQRKSEYLLRESVKYKTYVDALHEAATRKEEVYGMRDREKELKEGA